MNKRIRPNVKPSQTAGFTLVEMLVVVIMVGIMAAIMVPTWNAFATRQRLSTARDRASQYIRQVQSDARQSRIPRIVALDPNSGSPRIASSPYTLNTTPPAFSAFNNWTSLGEGLTAGMIRMSVVDTTKASVKYVAFDGNGLITGTPDASVAPKLPVYVTVADGKTSDSKSNRCVILDSLIGGLRLNEGVFNATDQSGCLP